MRPWLGWLSTLLVLGTIPCAARSLAVEPGKSGAAAAVAGRFTPLAPLAAPKLLANSEPYPGMPAANLLDGKENTEHSSNGKGTETFLELDFGRPVRIAAYRHVDRADPATVAAADLIFSDKPDFARPIARVSVPHANTRSGRTFFVLPSPITARCVRWQVTRLAQLGYGTVGGAEMEFFSSGEPEALPKNDTIELTAFPAVELKDGKPTRTVRLKIDHRYAESADAVLRFVPGQSTPIPLAPVRLRLGPGLHTVDVSLPALDRELRFAVRLEVGGQTAVQTPSVIRPVRNFTMYLLPHSHIDIGYTAVQTEIEKLQWKFMDDALEICRKTADYPPEARFKWNSEVLWAVDSYLKQATPQKRDRLIAAVKAGQIHLDALYGNELTGLCRPEELIRLTACARRLSKQYGVTIDAAMISDVPGCTWGIVPAMAQSGIKYFSIGTNHVHRIGRTLEAWADRPFWWVSPSGQERVLCWVAGKGYSGFHPGLWDRITKVKPEALLEYLEKMESSGFPYDVVQLRYSIGGDNGPPDADLPDFVKNWNARYVWPKLRIATTRELFEELEREAAGRIPEVRGDFTPYWEDGAGSSSLETGLARSAAERLVQAETLFALLNPRGYPAEDFYQAWRNVLLYNEHTWGAHCSISQPDSDFTKAQWKIKRAFALDGSAQSQKLLAASLAGRAGAASPAAAVEVFNTNSWTRTDLVILPAGMKRAGDVVKDAEGRPVPSQRLSSGELAFLATSVPPLGAARFSFHPGEPEPRGQASAEGLRLRNLRIRLSVDEKTGSVASFASHGLPTDLAHGRDGFGLNEYFYVAGRDPKSPQRSGKPTVRVKERGPLVASLVVESDAPGCRKLVRELRVVDGLERVDLVDLIDKKQVRTPESVHLGFAPKVPGGVMRMDVPWAVIRPEQDQLPGACKNYFSVGRWIDVSNDEFGLTCAALDSPLAEVGAITVDVLPNPFEAKNFIKTLPPSQTFFWYLMNNYWETNYKADQEGPIAFRYALMPHGPFDPVTVARFGVERSQPLVVVPTATHQPPVPALLRVEPAGVMVSSLKPADDGRGLVLRLVNVGMRPAEARLTWSGLGPKRVVLSSPKEEEGPAVSGPIEMPASGIVTLRVEPGDY